MTASNPAVDAQPGWRGTDPDGGTWILMHPDSGMDVLPWAEFTAGGRLVFRSQEEAEAAGLVAVVAETAVHELCEAIRLTAEYVGPKTLPAIDGWSWFDALVKYAPETAQVFSQAGWGHLSPAAAPAPLDPGNPEHLRQVAAFVAAIRGLDQTRLALPAQADRLDRDRAEAEQDASDRKLAERIARDAHERERGLTGTPTWGAITQESRRSQIEAALAGIRAADERAERAEREESGNVCVCGAMRIPADQLSVTVTDTVHRHGGPCYVAGGADV